MREVKFRAFDKKNNVMLQVVRLDYTMDSKGDHLPESIGYYLNGEFKGRHTKFNVDDVDLFESTGFKDRNSKEIYEGDLYKAFGVVFIVRFDICPDTGIMSVFLENTKGDFTTYQLTQKSTGEIIGDIYTNQDVIGTE